jgi:aspartokinase
MIGARPRYLDDVRALCAELAVPVRHSVAGSDTLLLVCPAADLERAEQELDARLRKHGAERVAFGAALALVGVVWSATGVDAAVLARGVTGLEGEGIAVRFVSAGESPHTALFGVDESRYEDAVRALYQSTCDQ